MTRRVETARVQHERRQHLAMPGNGEGYHIEESTPGHRWNAYAPDVVMDPKGWSYTPSVGHLLVQDYDGPSIQNLYVHPDHQRKGVARALWEKAGRPKHVPGAQTDDGKAWADAVGGEDLWWPGNEHLRQGSLNEALYRYAMPQKDFYDADFPQPKEMPKHEVKPGTVWYHASDSDMEPGTVLQPGHVPSRNDYSGPLAPRQHQVFMTDDPYYASAYGRWLYEIEPQGEGPYPWNGGVDENDDGMPPWAASSAKVIRKVPLPWERAALRTAMPRQDYYDLVTHEEGYAKEPPVVGEMDQTPVRPGPWYHSTDRLLEPGTVLDSKQPNSYNYWREELTPRDHAVFMHHDPDMTEQYGSHLYEVKPMGEGPFAYNGEDHAQWDGYASPKARVIREIERPGQEPEVKNFADAMAMMAKIAMPVGGEIHRGLTLDMDAVSPQMRKILTDYGPESPEFIQELLRHGTGTYWSRDKGFAEGVNPGNGLQVALSADWDGNGAQPLHNENLRKLPDSWGDMSLLAPSDNTVAKEFNLKPGKELNVKSIRVRKKEDPNWRELLRQPTRARTARLVIAMPMKDAWDAEYKREDWPWDYKTDAERDVVPEGFHQGPWHHATDLDYDVGDIITPNKGYFPSRFNRYYERSGHGDRQNWVWVDAPESIRHQWGSGSEHNVYEVEPMDEGPWPFNGGDIMGYVTPRVRVKKRIKQKTAPPPKWQHPQDMVPRLIGPPPPDPNADLDYEDEGLPKAAARSDAYDTGQLPPDGPDQTPVRPGPWYHSTDAELAAGDVLDPTKPNNFDYGGVNPGWEPRDNWVFMDNAPNGEYGHNEYIVEPLDEGPYPWNGNDSNVFPGGNLNGYASPRARVVERLPRGYAADYYQKNPQLLETDYGTDKAAMVLGMCTVNELVNIVKETSWQEQQ